MRTTRMDENEIHVIDDVISSPYQDLIEKKVLSNEFSYYFEADIGHIDNRGGGNFGFGIGMFSTVFLSRRNSILSFADK